MTITIRNVTSSDIPAIAQLFQLSIQQATAREYDEAQRAVWAARGADTARWQTRITTQHFLLAEQPKRLLGFGSVDARGYLDVLYVHPAHQDEGIASRLLAALERWALDQGVICTYADASLTALPFFERRGYRLIAEQTHQINGVTLVNYRMEKPLR